MECNDALQRPAIEIVARAAKKLKRGLYNPCRKAVVYCQLTHHAWKEYSAQLHRLGQLVSGPVRIPATTSVAYAPGPSGTR